MRQTQLKLKLTRAWEAQLKEWLWSLTGVHNFAVRIIEQDAEDGIYCAGIGFQNLPADHGKKIGVPSPTVQGMRSQVHSAWSRCFKKIGGKPKRKGMRRKLNSIPLPDPIRSVGGNHIKLPGVALLRFHEQEIAQGKIKCARIVKRASGRYLCLFIDAQRKPNERKAYGAIGIEPGYKDLITAADDEKIAHRQELQRSIEGLGQGQRGINCKLVASLHERIGNQRKDRNHKLSLRVVQENKPIVSSKDNIAGIAKRFGKSVASSGHAQRRSMLSCKGLAGGTDYIKVASKNSTRTCSACGSLSGPTGSAGLSVRHWQCGCGAEHDRDTNAARNTPMSGLGKPPSELREAA